MPGDVPIQNMSTRVKCEILVGSECMERQSKWILYMNDLLVHKVMEYVIENPKKL
jgi:hypothetical protein